MDAKERVIQRTAYPHIVKIGGVCGGEAIIEGTRIAVWHIVDYYYKLGMSADEISMDWDYLTPAQVFSALAYYHDNLKEVDRVRYRNSYRYWKEHYANAYPQPAQDTFE
jgi:uncharacterized protein (DUF433 family)